ncbi:MAG: type IV fimbrial biogenesis protein FimT [Glaciecola sp.]|jgi:type IV fimbrial biogenesis protein FimT
MYTDSVALLLYSLPVLIRSSEVKFGERECNALRKSDSKSLKSFRGRKKAYHKRLGKPFTEKGMTLIEMLVALAVVAIVLTVVAPNVQTILSKNRTTSEINELSAVIQFARFTAIDQTSTAVICPSTNYASCSTDWNQAKIVFIDSNGNNTRDTAEPLLMSTTAIASTNTMTGPAVAISFLDSGVANASTSIKVCPNTNVVELARSININAQGRVRVSIDSDKNDIFEDTDGNELSCS